MNNLMVRFHDETLGEFEYLKLNLLTIIKSRNVLEIDLSCPRKYEETVRKNLSYLEKVFADILDVDYKIEVKYNCPVFEKDKFIQDVIDFLDAYPVVKGNLKRENISVEDRDDSIKCALKFDKSTYDYCRGINLVLILNKFARDKYFDTISFEISSYENSFDFSVLEKNDIIVEDKNNLIGNSLMRRITVTDVERYIGYEITGDAFYIEDATEGEKIFCGTIENYTEIKRKPKEGEKQEDLRPFYKFVLRDFTGEINCVYFPTKASFPKMAEIKNGITVKAQGMVEKDNYTQGLVFKIRSISFCKLPENFEKVIIKRCVPREYICVHPKPYFTAVQKDLFGLSEIRIPPYLSDKTFCVFDTETTGLEPRLDKIIEIGAVLLEHGKITQTFQSFINPHRGLTPKIRQLTNITEADLINAPETEDVLSDFYKFSYGLPLVGHNIKFDYEFITMEGKPYNIVFENELVDTLTLSQKFLSLRHYKLDNVAKYFAIVNEGAHRAIYDALTTAKIFMKFAERL